MHFDVTPLTEAAARKGKLGAPAIARHLELPRITVYRWLNGHSAPNGPALATIERKLGVTAADLFTEAPAV